MRARARSLLSGAEAREARRPRLGRGRPARVRGRAERARRRRTTSERWRPPVELAIDLDQDFGVEQRAVPHPPRAIDAVAVA